MQKWEYKIVKEWPMTELLLNELGNQGWELIESDYDNGWFILKRPL